MLDTDLPVIVMTAYATIDRAVQATRAGAFAFVTKPLRFQEILIQIRNACDLRTLRRVVRPEGRGPILGRSAGLLRALAQADRAAMTDLTVLVTGESGTGKELLASRIHHTSQRAKKPFVAVNCGGIPETLLESELFGHSRGAFTGAARDRPGLLEVADAGTLFLDEVGELSPSAQVRLLRFLQEGRLRRVGETMKRVVDVRVIAATHSDLRRDEFREDLYFRLAVLPIELPPLRARGEDVLTLFGHALRAACKRFTRPVPMLSSAAIAALRAYSWPGNVRELLNVADQLAVLTTSEVIELVDLPTEIAHAQVEATTVRLPEGDFDLTGWLEGLEERALKLALARNDNVKARATARAERMGRKEVASRTWILRRLQQ